MVINKREYLCKARVSKDPIDNLKFRIRHNLVGDIDRAKKKLHKLECSSLKT